MPRSSKKPVRPTTRKKRPQLIRSLAADEIRRIPKPVTNYEELVAKAVAAWKEVGGIKVTGLSAARLAALLRRAQAAQAKEARLRQRVAPAMKRAADARLVADAAAWKALLRLNDYATTVGRDTPAVARAFAFLKAALTRRPRPTRPTLAPTPGA